MKRILTLALSVVLLLSMLITDVGAIAVDYVYEKDPKSGEDTEEIDYEETVKQYLTVSFATAEEKLATMTMMYAADGYQLWVDELTGEVATKNLASGQILFSNPYDVGATYTNKKGPSEETKTKLMSQIMIKYDDNGTAKEMYSYTEAALRGQITIKNIKGGIRVEYSIGREETRMLVPKVIEKSAFETKILDVFAAEINAISKEQEDKGLIEMNWREYYEISKRGKLTIESNNDLWFFFVQFLSYYQLKAESECKTERERVSMYAAYPITKQMDVYVFATDATQTEIIKCENYIKTYVSSYTFEQLEIDHAKTGYEGTDKNPPLFKLSLEYTLDELGMSVRCPVNGLRFNESLYQLTYISILPYMGAAANHLTGEVNETFTGYNFFPDGSGTIFRHEDLAGSTTTRINAKVYGFDYAYNEITGNHAEVVRYPVFGIVSNYHDTRVKTVEVLSEPEIVDSTGKVIVAAQYTSQDVEYEYTEDRGFVAIIEEGDALAELSTNHEGALSKYNSISMLFYPRPKDSYNLANAISVGANATWTVVSSRKYVGNYKIRYIMLTDENLAKENNIEDYYEVSWMGMAEAYRDYLYGKGELTRLKAEDVEENIPAYIETFGATETVEKILSIPVNVMTPLTSFDNIKTMYDELSAEGVSNIKFKLTGYANGGIFASIPYNLEWEDAVGGDDGFTELLDYANQKGFEVFPDFDFAYVRASTNTLFDGLTLKDHIVKSINNTYMSKRYYSATRQTMLGRFELAVSAAYYSRFYDKLTENLLKYYKDGISTSISVASLGNALNSDFDEDEPYNREDSKASTVRAFEALDGYYDNVMTESGNAYSWKYVDYILNLPLDSSRYTKSDASVPFIGVVLHGSKQFSGSPLNMEGNIGYSLLKAIENGAGLYFVLCYQNYAVLKDSPILSQYYSVRYDILKEDVVKYYKIVNDLTKDLQTEIITSHEFLVGERVPDADEIIADAIAAEKSAKDAAAAAAAQSSSVLAKSLLNGRLYALSSTTEQYENILAVYNEALGHVNGGYRVADNGAVTVYDGMNTLVNRVVTTMATAKKASDAKETALVNKNKTAAMAEALANVMTPIEAVLNEGRLKAYKDLEKTLTDNKAKTEASLNTAATKLAALADAYTAAIKAGINNIPLLVKTYEETEDEKAKADALEKILLFAGTLADAKAYAETKSSADALEAELAAFETANSKSEAFLALEQAVNDAKAAYDAAIASSAVVGTKDYERAVEKLETAKTNLEEAIGYVETRIKNINKKIVLYSETESEYTILVNLLAESEQELADLKDATKSSTYSEAVDKAYADLDALDETIGNARKAIIAAENAVEANSSAYAASYKTSAEYVAAETELGRLNAEIAKLEEKFEKNSPIIAAYNKLIADLDVRQAATVEKNNVLNSFLETETYKTLRKAYDDAQAALYEATYNYTSKAKETEQYKTLLKNLQGAEAAYLVYANGYKKDDAYQPLEEAYVETSTAIEEMLNAYKNTDEYKTLVANKATADAAYEKAVAKVDTTGKTKLSDADMKTLLAALDAKSDADAALASFVEKSEAEVVSSTAYKVLVRTATTEYSLIENYVKIYLNKLDRAAEDSRQLTHPEETDGGKYDIAKTAYEKALNEYNTYIGTGTNSYAAKLTADAAYTKATADLKTAKTNYDNYVNGFKTKVVYVDETKIATITDADIKAANVKYVEAQNKYLEADKAVKSSANDLNDLSASLYTAVNQYYSAISSFTAANAEKVAAKNLEISSLKAEYEAFIAVNSELLDLYEKAVADKADAAAAYTAAVTADATASKAQTDAVNAVRTLSIRIRNLTYTVENYITIARSNLADSNLAVETLGNDTSYAESLRKDLLETNKKMIELENEIHKLSDGIVGSSSLALSMVPDYISVEKTVNDPYVEKKTETKTSEKKDEYVVTKYTDNSGNIVKVGYSNGVVFILNYNYFTVTTVVDGKKYEIPAYGGYKINADGTSAVFTTALAKAED